jgi:hypothetical protein
MTTGTAEVPILQGLRLTNSPLPLYYQVGLYLEDAIRTGTIPAGTFIDGEIPWQPTWAFRATPCGER